MLKTKTDEAGSIVVERPHRGLKRLDFCKKGAASAVEMNRYDEILVNCE